MKQKKVSYWVYRVEAAVKRLLRADRAWEATARGKSKNEEDDENPVKRAKKEDGITGTSDTGFDYCCFFRNVQLSESYACKHRRRNKDWTAAGNISDFGRDDVSGYDEYGRQQHSSAG